MKSVCSIVLGLGCLTASTVLGCGSSSDDDPKGTGGGAGSATGGSAGPGTDGGSSGSGSGGFGGFTMHDVCADVQALADEHNQTLNCQNAGTAGNLCEVSLLIAPDCEDEFEAAQSCLEALPASSFECDAIGFVAPVEGSCPTETAAVDACLQ